MSAPVSTVGLMGLATMGQNLALNIADKGFSISVYNRSGDKTDDCVARAKKENLADKVTGFKDLTEFVQSVQKPRAIIMLIKAGKPVDLTIEALKKELDEGDMIIDGGNEWYVNTERRAADLKPLNIKYMGMGVSGGSDGARYGPSLMPGGPPEVYKRMEPILVKIAAQVEDGPCVTHIGEGGAGNYVKMVHNGIEYGDMQLIAEAYDLLKSIGGLSNKELAATFKEWNSSELDSYLIEITYKIFTVKDELEEGDAVDKVLDKTGMKGTGRWTVQEAAEQSVAAPTITAALDARYLSGLLDQRKEAAKVLVGPSPSLNDEKKAALIEDVKAALYAAKICSYAQGMSLIQNAGKNNNWDLDLSTIARIWKGGCIIRAKFLDRIKGAFDRDANLANLLMDKEVAVSINERQAALRRVVGLAISEGIAVPAFSGSLAYFDAYRRPRLPANLTQAQRDFFGAHTYERTDKEGSFHTEWEKLAKDPSTL